jgi:hypothetical protein
MEASQHRLLAACITLHSIYATLAIVPQRGAGLWIAESLTITTCTPEDGQLGRNMPCPTKEYEEIIGNDVALRRHKSYKIQIYIVQQDAEI